MKPMLVVDIGNQDTVVAAFADNQLLHTARFLTHHRSVTEMEQGLDYMARKHSLLHDGVAGVLVGSVVPQVNYLWEEAVPSIFGVVPELLTFRHFETFLKLDVERPEDVGVDRLANALAATHFAPHQASVVIDFGTATTLDVVGANGVYRGGIIAPGLNLAMDALSSRAALLPRISVLSTPSVIGRSTVEAMTVGVYWGYVSMVEGFLKRLRQEMRERFGESDVRLFATGGQASLICPQLNEKHLQMDPVFTLRGLLLAKSQPDQSKPVNQTVRERSAEN